MFPLSHCDKPAARPICRQQVCCSDVNIANGFPGDGGGGRGGEVGGGGEAGGNTGGGEGGGESGGEGNVGGVSGGDGEGHSTVTSEETYFDPLNTFQPEADVGHAASLLELLTLFSFWV